MRTTLTLVTSLVLAASCTGPDEPTAYLEVVADGPIETIEVWVKRYLDGGGTVVRRLEPLEIPAERGGYVVGGADDPLRLRIDLLEPGRYAFHLVARPSLGEPLPDGPPAREGDVLMETRCLVVEGEVADRGGILAVLRREHDDDRDTFPEDGSWCTDRGLRGVHCDERCERPEFSALLDCNPASRVPEAGCGEVPADAQHHPFALDLCADCYDQDCYGGDARCEDRDGDGFPAGLDCDDDDAAIHPGAEEVCGNGIDDNCVVDFPGCDHGDAPCDADADGYVAQVSTTCGVDCDDDDPAIHPLTPEGCGTDVSDPMACPGCDDLVDNDCDGHTNELCTLADDDIDNDGIPYLDEATGAVLDCNDCNAAVGPGRADACGNGIDEDCSADDLTCAPGDLDRDGYQSFAAGGTDCDDTDEQSHPGAPERCGDGVAQGCADDLDCGTIEDADGDRFAAGTPDCDDENPAVHPFAQEECDPAGTDEDCDGLVNEVEANRATNRGCGFDDGSESWFPIDFETDPSHCGGCRRSCCAVVFRCAGDRCVRGVCSCGGRGPCSGTVDDTCCADGCQDLGRSLTNCGVCGNRCALNEVCQPDPANHGLGACLCPAASASCPAGPGSACCADGCVNLWEDPSNCGYCGNDCADGFRGDLCAVDGEGVARCYCGGYGVVCGGETWCTDLTEPAGSSCGCADLDSDPANCGACGHACGVGEICFDGSCGCSNESGTPETCSAGEVCCAGTGCVDLGSDERACGACGTACVGHEVCRDGECWCTTPSDCNDGDRCTTDQCDGSGRCVYTTLDGDSDGWCDPWCPTAATGTPDDCRDSDCDDARADVYPGAPERCSTAYDDDCDGDTNDLNATGCTNRYRDNDRDGYYPAGAPSECRCSAVGAYTATTSGDCDDARADVYPGAPERCSTAYDDDCDGDTNDPNATGCTTRYRDNDRDGYYPAGAPSECRCSAFSTFTATTGGDCDDGNRNISPAATETCATAFDDDCDGAANERDATGCTVYFADTDDDGYGAPATQCWCTGNGIYTATVPGDCHDGEPSINPGADEMCDGRNEDCDSGTPDGADECAGFCCGGACQECCNSAQCPGADNRCVEYMCTGEPPLP